MSIEIMNLNEVEEKELVPGFNARFVHTNNMTLVYWRIDEGSKLPLHSHHHEQVVNVIEGTLEFDCDGDVSILEPGAVAIVPPNVPHSGKAIKACRLIDVFHPAREDYK
ncbi:MAG: cupin domain-containing protein [bacterium]|nr:cupin domain-containing protein [bacterium]